MKLRQLLTTLAVGTMLAAALFRPAAARAEDLTISAAISLKGSLDKVKPELEKIAGGKISYNYDSSGKLSAQILSGAPVDLFLSADQQNVDKLQKAERTLPGSEKVFVFNDLVLVTPAGSSAIKSIEDLTSGSLKKLAIGEPKSVPAGKYAQQTLTTLKLYDSLRAADKLVLGGNVSEVRTYVERGEVDAGFVYRSDAQSSAKLTVVDVAPDASHEPIIYKMALIKDSKNLDAARKVQDKLLTPEIQAVFVSFGFKAAVEPAKK